MPYLMRGIWARCTGEREVYYWTSPVTNSRGQGPEEWREPGAVLFLLHLIRRELPAARCCNHSSVLLFCGTSTVFSVPLFNWSGLWLSSEAVSTSSKFSAFPSCFLQPPLRCSDWGDHPGVLAPHGFAVDRGELV